MDGVAAQLRCCPDPFQKFGGTSVLSTAPPPPDGQCYRSGSPTTQAAVTWGCHPAFLRKPTPRSDISRGGGGGGQAEGSEAWTTMTSQDHQGQRELTGEGGGSGLHSCRLWGHHPGLAPWGVPTNALAPAVTRIWGQEDKQRPVCRSPGASW